MTEPLHFDIHPDADQLSAFVEQALPEHEHLVMLAHLADCADCRQIAFLVQQATEIDAPKQTEVPLRQPWFRRWNLVWPAAAALACALMTVVILREVKPKTLPQQARNYEPQPPSSAQKTPVPEPKTVVKPAPASKQLPTQAHSSIPRRSEAVSSALEPANPAARDQVLSRQTVNELPLQGRNVQNLVQLNGQTSSHSESSIHGAVAGAVSKQALMVPPQAALPTNSVSALNTTQDAAVAAPVQKFRQQVGPIPAAAPQSTSETVEVSSAAPILQTESSALTGRIVGSTVALPSDLSSLLPSKLPAKLRLSNGHETLAVDTEGQLFLSQDAGVHWQKIKQQWTGKITTVVLTSNTPVEQEKISKTSPTGSIKSATSLASASRVSSTRRPGFELTTDTGASWTSSDGFVWSTR